MSTENHFGLLRGPLQMLRGPLQTLRGPPYKLRVRGSLRSRAAESIGFSSESTPTPESVF